MSNWKRRYEALDRELTFVRERRDMEIQDCERRIEFLRSKVDEIEKAPPTGVTVFVKRDMYPAVPHNYPTAVSVGTSGDYSNPFLSVTGKGTVGILALFPQDSISRVEIHQ